ncbi:hypothetical protein X801_03193 [Opisthorchis viverrini]|uniref:Transmembrane protein 208 n=2 Tax=Opisthorchis viverrini TaxID=6198 RepID=A0A074ZGE7_OPIVI|nr:hypothetical protein T265_09548 [Opisthorchis viverrini]KER22330.1 hypothetical protein T265_09548 [Opisthorchis viverrini]OON20917.1 hypothetical protein X801_03193 [Opisthorchis viverrini]
MFTPKKNVKEGSKSEKMIHEANISTLRFYRISVLSTLAIYSSVTFLFLWSSFTTRYVILASVSFAICLAAYKFMSHMASPTFGENDRGVVQLQDAGLDLNIGTGGIAEHAKDVIIMCCAVLLLSLLHRYFWFLMLVIPFRLLHLLWVNILAPWIFDPNQEPQVNEKKQQKLERKMRRIGHLTQGGRR